MEICLPIIQTETTRVMYLAYSLNQKPVAKFRRGCNVIHTFLSVLHFLLLLHVVYLVDFNFEQLHAVCHSWHVYSWNIQPLLRTFFTTKAVSFYLLSLCLVMLRLIFLFKPSTYSTGRFCRTAK